MLKPVKNCLVCKTLKTDRRLLQRIYDSKAYVDGGESLKSIARAYENKFGYQSLYNHANNHQGLSLEDVENRQLVKKAHEIEFGQIKEILSHKKIRNELIGLGTEKIKDGEVKMTASAVVALLKQQADIELKEKDQELEMAKMIADYASGAFTDVIEGEIVGT